MQVIATDNFTRANENPIASPWIVGSGANAAMQLLSNHVEPSSLASNCQAIYIAGVWPPNQYSQAAITVTGLGGTFEGPGVSVRMSTSADTYYRVTVNTFVATDNVSIIRRIDGAEITVLTFTQAWVNGDVLRLEIAGAPPANTLKVFQNGVQIGSTVVDTGNIAAGYPGLFYSSTTTVAQMDTWEGGGALPAVDYSQFPKPNIAEAAARGEM